jgi:hypothetical protein
MMQYNSLQQVLAALGNRNGTGALNISPGNAGGTGGLLGGLS